MCQAKLDVRVMREGIPRVDSVLVCIARARRPVTSEAERIAQLSMHSPLQVPPLGQGPQTWLCCHPLGQTGRLGCCSHLGFILFLSCFDKFSTKPTQHHRLPLLLVLKPFPMRQRLARWFGQWPRWLLTCLALFPRPS